MRFRPVLLEWLSLVPGLAVYLCAWHKDHFLEYDESHTLRIAAQDWPSQFLILSQEPNFPPYYLLLSLLGANPSLIITVNLGVWLLTLYFARRLLGLWLTGPWQRAMGLWAFACTPRLLYHIDYIRMYGLTSMIQAAALYGLLVGGRRRQLARGLVVLQTWLHPMGVISALTFALGDFLFTRSRRGPLLTACLSLVSLALLVGGKSEPVPIYFERSTYVENFGRSLAVWGSNLYTAAYFDTTPQAFVHQLFLSLVGLALPALPALRANVFPALLQGLWFVAVPLLQPHAAEAHHAGFFAAPFALVLIVGCQRSLRQSLWRPCIALAVGLLLGHFTWMGSQIWANPLSRPTLSPVPLYLSMAGLGLATLALIRSRLARPTPRLRWAWAVLLLVSLATASARALYVRIFERDSNPGVARDFFRKFADVPGGVAIFTTFTRFNILDRYWRKTAQDRIFLAEECGFLDTTGLSARDMLIEQARRNGLCDSPLMTYHYLQKAPGVRLALQRTAPEWVVLFYYGSRPSEPPLGSVRLPGYRFARFYYPAQVVFRRDPA